MPLSLEHVLFEKKKVLLSAPLSILHIHCATLESPHLVIVTANIMPDTFEITFHKFHEGLCVVCNKT